MSYDPGDETFSKALSCNQFADTFVGFRFAAPILGSFHVHLLVKDTGVGVIPRSMQLVAGRVAQEFNLRKGRRGAFWQGRYHATAVEDNHHSVHAMIYIDLNMLRAGVISHTCQWPFCGYYELMTQRKRYSIINRRELMRVIEISDDPALILGIPKEEILSRPRPRSMIFWPGVAFRAVFEEEIAMGIDPKSKPSLFRGLYADEVAIGDRYV